MPRFYFHLWTGDDYELDADGLVLADAPTAFLEAFKAAQEIAADMILSNRNPTPYRYELLDDSGIKLFELPFSEVVGFAQRPYSPAEVLILAFSRMSTATSSLTQQIAMAREALQTSKKILADSN